MNKVIISGKLLEVKRISEMIFVYTVGISGQNHIVDFLFKKDNSEFINSYIYAEGFISERDGYTAIFATFIKKTKIKYLGDV